jgi:cis-3-alkyl-4-acyloxetan-2-one decarboxylase
VSATATVERLAARARLVAPFAEEYPFAPRYLEVGPHALHYVDEGPRHADPVLLVHGNPTWSFLWRHAIADLRGTRRCVAPDHLGCGLSDKPADGAYRLADHVANLERLVLGLDLRRIALVVHDWGGAIGAGVAVRHPERFARLVILNSAAFPGGRAPLRIRACRAPVLGPLVVRGLNVFARAAQRMAVARPDRLTAAARRGFLAPYDSYGSRIATLRFVQDIPLSPAHPSHGALAAIDAGLARLAHLPACLIWGERDWCFTPAFREQWLLRFPRARVHLAPDAGHWVLEDAREDALAWLRAFLDDTDPGR